MSETQEAYWVYEVYDQPNAPSMVDDSESYPEPVDTVTVYRPVIVETGEDGGTVAYYYDTDADAMDVYETGGKRYVPTQQVHRTPPPYAEPAYRYE